MLLALLFAGIAEGVGVSALLPLLSIVVSQEEDSGATHTSEYEQTILDTLTSMGIQPGIGSILILIVIAVFIKSSLLLIANRQVGYTASQVTTDLRLELLRAVLRSKWEYFVHQPIGQLANSLATEARRSSKAYVTGVLLITFALQSAVYAAIAIAVSWQSTLISLGAGILVLGVSHSLVRVARKAGKKQTRLLNSLLTRLTDTLQSVKPLKSMAREHLVDSVLTIETWKLNKALRKEVFSTALLNSGQDLMLATVIAVGLYVSLVKYDMPFPTVMVLVIALGRMLSQIGKVQKQYQKLSVNESAYWSLQRTVKKARKAAEDLRGNDAPPNLDQGITLNNIRFSYGERDILSDLSMDIPAGQLTTLIGPSGAGKTTIIDLIIRLLTPASGEIFVDGKSLSSMDIRAWRTMIGYVPQETILLHDSIFINVTLGDENLSEEDAISALKTAGIWDFVTSLPDGIHSSVGERGGRLSGGQRQRIIIARALVNNPRLLILDEATSALDPESSQAIRHCIDQLRGKLTILAISHQPMLVDAADKVYKLENGKAVLQ